MLPAATEVHCDGNGAYHAHAIAGFRAYEYAPKLDAINPLFLSHPAMVCSHPGCYSSGNRRGQQFGPCLRLTKEVTKY